MEIRKETVDNSMTIRLKGRLETSTAPKLEEVVENELGEMIALTVNMAQVEYVSSAGLRVLLAAEKKMKAKGGTLVVEEAVPAVRDVFKITGFDKILTLR